MYFQAILAYIIKYLQENWLAILRKIFLGILVFVIAYYISKKIVAKVRRKLEANPVQQNPEYAKKFSGIIGTVIFILLMIFTVLAVFQVIGFDAALIMGGISLGVGFAMETTITDMIGGIMLLTNQKVRIGDYVSFLGTLKFMGTIEEITIRYTIVKTFDKRRVIVPNSVLMHTPIQTMKSEPLVRGEITFRVPRHVLVSQVREIMLGSINAHKAVSHKEYTSVLISGFDTFGTSIQSYFFVNQTLKGASAYGVGRDLTKSIFEEFKKYGINVPYEQIVLMVE